MPTTPSTPQHIDSYSIISISGHRLTSSSGKWGLDAFGVGYEAKKANRGSRREIILSYLKDEKED